MDPTELLSTALEGPATDAIRSSSLVGWGGIEQVWHILFLKDECGGWHKAVFELHYFGCLVRPLEAILKPIKFIR